MKPNDDVTIRATGMPGVITAMRDGGYIVRTRVGSTGFYMADELVLRDTELERAGQRTLFREG